jgi:hypothetical protein
VRLAGGASRVGSLWTVEPLAEAAVSAELTLRLAGDELGDVAAAGVAAAGLWFAEDAGASPRPVAALAALSSGKVSTDSLVAVGVVFAADGARIVAAGADGTVAYLNSAKAPGSNFI